MGPGTLTACILSDLKFYGAQQQDDIDSLQLYDNRKTPTSPKKLSGRNLQSRRCGTQEALGHHHDPRHMAKVDTVDGGGSRCPPFLYFFTLVQFTSLLFYI